MRRGKDVKAGAEGDGRVFIKKGEGIRDPPPCPTDFVET